MSDRFQKKYRIDSARLKHWDYGWNASYFVTICLKNRICLFGDVIDDVVVLNDIGKIAQDCWLAIPEHFPFVKLGNHIVMPNHIHGIVVIDKNDDQRNETRLSTPVETPKLGVSTTNATDASNTTPPTNQTKTASLKWNPGSLGVIINQYKRAVTINARKINADFAWQPRFHDHVIRNEESFRRISEYIINNPMNWLTDQFR